MIVIVTCFANWAGRGLREGKMVDKQPQWQWTLGSIHGFAVSANSCAAAASDRGNVPRENVGLSWWSPVGGWPSQSERGLSLLGFRTRRSCFNRLMNLRFLPQCRQESSPVASALLPWGRKGHNQHLLLCSCSAWTSLSVLPGCLTSVTSRSMRSARSSDDSQARVAEHRQDERGGACSFVRRLAVSHDAERRSAGQSPAARRIEHGVVLARNFPDVRWLPRRWNTYRLENS